MVLPARTGARWVYRPGLTYPGSRILEGRCILMADLGGMADKAKDSAQDNPEKVDQTKDKIKDAVDGNKDDDQN